MKKIVCILCAASLLLLFLPVVSAESPVSPWSSDSIKVDVYEDLTGFPDQTKDFGTACTVKIKNGSIAVTKCDTSWYGVSYPLAADVSCEKAQGVGFYVENNTSVNVYIVPSVYCGSEISPAKGDPITVFDTTSGSCSETAIQAYGTYLLYPGFKGYFAIPAEVFKLTSESVITAVNLKFSAQEVFTEGEIMSDNYFIYGKDVKDNNPGLIETDTAGSEAAFTARQQELADSMADFCETTPSFTYVPAYDIGTIKAITYESAEINGKKTKAFAYLGYPEGAKAGDKLPAVVLVHGGGGHAFSDWVKYWNDNGYVALAMDNTGFFPKGNQWVWGVNANPDFAQADYASVPQCDAFSSADGPLERQWIYHAVAQTILARNLLAADAAVDPAKVGLTGISWGSTISSIAIGFAKFAFAVPQYCSAYFSESLTHTRDYYEKTKSFQYLWKAESRFDNIDFPVLWLQWTKDSSASVNTNSHCYSDTLDTAQMTLRYNWQHGHDWNTAIETVRFADAAVKGGPGLTAMVTQPDGTVNIDFKIKPCSDAKTVTAKAYYITEKLAYESSKIQVSFSTVACKVEDNRITGVLPDNAYSFYVEVSTIADGKTYYTATLFQDVKESLPVATGTAATDATDAPTGAPTKAPTVTASVASKPSSPLVWLIPVCLLAVAAAAAAVVVLKRKH